MLGRILSRYTQTSIQSLQRETTAQNLWLQQFISYLQHLVLCPVWNVIALAAKIREVKVSFECPDIIKT